MAYVSKVSSTGFSSLPSKKFPTFSNSGLPSSSSSSSKHIYDGVFTCQNKFKSCQLSSFSDDDYAEVFGCSKFDDDVWQSSCSSIPVMELPVFDSEKRGREFDYCRVLGGFDIEGFDVPNGETFFDQLNKKAKISPLPVPRSIGQTNDANKSHMPSQSQNGQASMNGFSKAFDDVKHRKQKANEMPSNDTSVEIHVGHFHANPGSNNPLNGAPLPESLNNKTPVTKVDTEVSVDMRRRRKHIRSSSSDLGLDKQKIEHDVGFQEAPGVSESNSAAISHATNKLINQTSEAAYVAHVHVMPDSVDLSHEIDPSPVNQTTKTPMMRAHEEFGMDINLVTKEKHSRHTSSDLGADEQKNDSDAGFPEVPCLNATDSAATLSATLPSKMVNDDAGFQKVPGSNGLSSKEANDNVVMELDVKENIGTNESSYFGADKQNNDVNATSHEASGLTGSSSVASLSDPCQTSGVSRSPKMVKDDAETSVSFGSEKKQRKHSRMTSLDLGASRRAEEHDAELRQKSRLRGSYSFDASHDSSAGQIKVQPLKVVPSSSQPHFFPVESHYKISENSSGSNFPPSLDEQLDMSSLASISAAALQRAVEEAEMKIQLAKEFLERKGQGSTKLRFKDTLKVKIVKENKRMNKANKVREKNEDEDVTRADDAILVSAPFESKAVLKSVPFVPVLEDHSKFSKEGPSSWENAEQMSTEEIEKYEAREWEATKHLNQLITGVKNRIASFMTWQVESEKKEDPKEVEPSKKQPHPSQYGGLELKETDKNQSETTFTDKMEVAEKLTGIVPPEIEPEESKSTKNDTSEQEKVGNLADVKPDIGEPIATNFLFFTFSSERSQNRSYHEVEKEEFQRNAEIAPEDKREQLVDEVMNEQIQGKGYEANLEGLHDTSMNLDCETSRTQSSSEEHVEAVEECYPMAAHDGIKSQDNEKELSEGTRDDSELNQEDFIPGISEEYGNDSTICEEYQNDKGVNEERENDRVGLTQEEENDRRMGFESGDDSNACTREEYNDTRVNEGCGDCAGISVHEEKNDKILYEECVYDTGTSAVELDGDRVSHEECVDDTSTSAHELDDERVSHEECAGDTSTSAHVKDSDGMLCEELEDDRSRSADEVENRRLTEEHVVEPITESSCSENVMQITEKDDDGRDKFRVLKEAEDQKDYTLLVETNLVGKAGKIAGAAEEGYESPEIDMGQCSVDHVEEVLGQTNGGEEDQSYQTVDAEETIKKEDEQVNYTTLDDNCRQIEDVIFNRAEELCNMDGNNLVGEAGFPVGDCDRMMEIIHSPSDLTMDFETTAIVDKKCGEKMEITHHSFEPESGMEGPVLSHSATECIKESVFASVSVESTVKVDEIEHLNDADAPLPCDNCVPHECETDVNSGKRDLNDEIAKVVSKNISENQAKQLHESVETLDVGKAPSVNDQETEKSSVEGIHRRKRWFENEEKVGTPERLVILEGDRINPVVDQDVLEESDLAGSVEIHADKVDSEAGVADREADTVLTPENSQVSDEASLEATHKRRRWFVNGRGEGVLEPRSLFEGIKVSPETSNENVNGSMPHGKSDEHVDKSSTEFKVDKVASEGKDKQNVEATPRRKRWFESGEKAEPAHNLRSHEDDGMAVERNQEDEVRSEVDKLGNMPTMEKGDESNKEEPVKEVHSVSDAASKRRKEKEKERLAVERAIREARERAFAEVRERARRDATEKPHKASCQKAVSGEQDKPVKVSAEGSSSCDKVSSVSMEAKLKAERAAVERATAEARERALQKALSEKASQRSRELGRHPERSSSLDIKYSRGSSSSTNTDKLDKDDGESAQRRKARLERQKRTMERAAKALEEKNKRDLLAQKEQAARNMLADTLDAEVKRWSSGKEENLRALLSTLQYILGSDSGWQAISLTELVTATAVRKAYKKATLCVHPDKLQQRGATIQQKYICEKVFDLLKDAWSRFNPDER